MKNFLYKLLITAGILLLVATLAFADPVKAITWGEPDLDNTFSNVGAIVVDLTDRDPLELCSGTLIAPTVFLTAGHCTAVMDELVAVGRLSLETTRLSFSPVNILDSSTWLEVTGWVTHPQYGIIGPTSNYYDVGLVLLAEPVDLPLALLPEEGFLDELERAGVLFDGPDRSDFLVVGYGQTLIWPPPENIDNGTGRWFAYSEFRALTFPQIMLNQNLNLDNSGACFGDSGGPVFFEYRGKLWLVGITSMGDAWCISASFKYRVDIADTLDFIAPYVP